MDVYGCCGPELAQNFHGWPSGGPRPQAHARRSWLEPPRYHGWRCPCPMRDGRVERNGHRPGSSMGQSPLAIERGQKTERYYPAKRNESHRCETNKLLFPGSERHRTATLFIKKLQLFWLQPDAKSCNLETERSFISGVLCIHASCQKGGYYQCLFGY